MMKDAMWLAGKELKSKWMLLLGSSLFYIYAAVMLLGMTTQFGEAEPSQMIYLTTGLALNFFVMAVLPNLGFPLTRRYMSYRKTDTFTKQLAALKLLPISNEAIVWGRFIQLLATMTVMSVVLFAPYYLVLYFAEENVPDGFAYIAFALFWMGYSMVLGSVNVYWELGSGGKAFFRKCLWSVPAYAGAAVLLWLLLDESIWTLSQKWVEQPGGFLIAAGAVAAGLISIYATGKALIRKLKKRDLYAE